ncbi:MAG: cellulose synthase complex periplasmic endoglucanase BcsZ [Acetobacter sp.]
MNKFFKILLVTGALALSAPVQAQPLCDWPLWEQFRQDYISADGRVIDRSDPRQITTSEGQAYALFFSLVANDRQTFDRVETWTRNNLMGQGATLPAWLWGHDAKAKTWAVLDSNSASDADLWLAWTLLEAGRLWKRPDYITTGKTILTQVVQKETALIPDVGRVLLPGPQGFTGEGTWRLNPSYLPPFMVPRFASLDPAWKELGKTNLRLLQETAPRGFAPDWVNWDAGKGWRLQASASPDGSYDAIRVYLWVGMMSSRDPNAKKLIKNFKPFADMVEQNGAPPEHVAVVTGQARGQGNVGFVSAVLPLMQDSAVLPALRTRVQQTQLGDSQYYSYVLTLFGTGWDTYRFRFDAQGHLVSDWSRKCSR